MKKFLVIFIGLMMIAPVFADEPTYPTAGIASPSYVYGAFSALDTSKQAALVGDTSDTAEIGDNVVVDTGTAGPVVTNIRAESGVVYVAKGEIQVPVKASASATPSAHADIWIQ